MNKFNIGDEVVSIWESDKVGTIKAIDTMSYPEPKYTVVYPDGNEYANYGACFKLVVDVDDVLEKGNILVDDEFAELDRLSLCYKYSRVRIIKYESHIYYHKKINGEVVEFRELI